jgi:hypothetical protein
MIHAPVIDQIVPQRVDWVANSNKMVKALVVIGDYQVTLTERRYSNQTAADRREYHQTTRVYGAIDALVPEFAADEPFTNIAIPFQPETAQDKMRSKVWNAWKRSTTAEAANRLSHVLDQLGAFGGVQVPAEAIAEIKFSQKAGCTMCPCSPGFVLGGTVRSKRTKWDTDYTGPVDIWIEKIA